MDADRTIRRAPAAGGSGGAGVRARDDTRDARDTDVTARLAELELIYRWAPVGLCAFDRELRFLRINERLAEMNGLPVRAHLGRTVRELLPDLADAAEATLRRVLDTGEPVRGVEFTGTTPARPGVHRTWVEDWLPLVDPHGAIVGVHVVAEEVTDRRRAAEERERLLAARRASEARRALALRAGRMATWEYDVVARRGAGDERLAEMLGIPHVPENDGPERWLAAIDPRDRDRVRAEFEAAIEGRAAGEAEFRLRGTHGAPRWLQLSATRLCDDAGQVTHLVGIVQDVTERKRAALERERGRALLDAVLASIPAAVVISDANGALVRWNVANEQLWGNSGTEPASFTNVDSYARCRGWRYPSGEPLAAHDWPLARSLEHRERIGGELIEIEPFDGGERKIVLFMSAPVIVDEDVVGSVAVQTDLSAQIRGEQALEAVSARLLQATRAANLGIHEYYPDTGRIVWDARLREWWGLAADEPVTFAKFLRGVHPDDRATMQAAVDRALDPAQDGRFDAEYRVQHPDGSVRWVHATGQVSFTDGRAVRLVGAVQDVSTRRILTDELKAADRQKDVFLATLSHELRNPLSPISTAAELLGKPGLDAQQLGWAQAVIQRQVRHLARLLDDLLDVSRITQGKLTLRRQEVSLESVVDTAVEAARPLIDRRNHELTVSLPPASATLDVDPVRLSQVLANLLTNAAKYTDPGGRIRLAVGVEPERVVLAVEDDGIGIAADALPRLFDMFAQIHDATDRTDGGLGIGLALVKGLVEMHGGSVRATSEGPGRGSRFEVVLPLRRTAVRGAAPAGADASAPPRRRVLVVDDNRDAADGLALLLELDGHEVRVAYDARSALSIAPAFQPEVALLDIGLPGMSGYALAAAIRAEPWGRGLPLVAMTGWGRDEDRQRTAEAGFDVHFTKPVDPAKIQAVLASGLVRRRGPSGAASS